MPKKTRSKKKTKKKIPHFSSALSSVFHFPLSTYNLDFFLDSWSFILMERLPFVRKFRWKFSVSGMVLVLFLVPKTGTGLRFTIYKIPANFLLSLDMKRGTSNPNKWCKKISVVSVKMGKRLCLEKYSFFRKISTGMNRSISILHRISGFSMQMVSAHDFTDHK